MSTRVKYNPATQTENTYIRVNQRTRPVVILDGKLDALAGCTRSEECDFGDRCIRAHPALDFRVDHVRGQSTAGCLVRIVPA